MNKSVKITQALLYCEVSNGLCWVPQAYRNVERGKLQLMSPGYDRSCGIGFRSERDAK